ncbi:alanine racemase [candidate division KSB1 bacterium]|nr:alanine racemase [candidate division KSB1 bacterium]MBL7093079.1 alanine racemase [candidate division KSB1 bacterium]
MAVTDQIAKPTLLLDKEKALKNINAMADKAKNSKVRFRPHFKTHQSAQIGEWFKDFGVTSITVSSVEMAEYFANNGWTDISVAFPVNIREIKEINELAKKVCLHLLVESIETTNFLKKHLASPVQIWIKIDTGNHRTGILWKKKNILFELATEIQNSRNMVFNGILTHAGHTYHAKSKRKIINIYDETVSRLKQVQTNLQNAGFKKIELSIGDTPACSQVEDFSDVDEIRPGNFVFYDVMQLNLSACSEEKIAVGVACPVVAKHSQRNEIVIYGGAVHLSKEFIIDQSGHKLFGLVTQLGENGWGKIIQGTYVSGLSQEHGIIKTTDTFFDGINVGEILVILPVHSCLTVNLLKKCITLDGGEITVMP